MARSSEPGRSTANRLFAILDAFDRRHAVLTLSEISERSGIPMPTAMRLLRELVSWGAVERNTDHSYQIGVRLWQVGWLAPGPRDLRRVARPIMEHLHEATSEAVQLAILNNSSALAVEKISGSRSARNVTEVAAPLPLHATAVGKVMLGFTDGLYERTLGGRALRVFTPSTITNHRQLSEEIRASRRDHLGYSREEFTSGTSSVAAPVFAADGELVAVLGILTSSPIALRRLAPAVRTAAMSISDRLGHDMRVSP